MDSFRMHKLSQNMINDLIENIHPVISTYEKGKILIKGDYSERKLYVVLKGIVYLYTQNEYDENEMTAYFAKGQTFCCSMLAYSGDQSIRYALCKTECAVAAVEIGFSFNYLTKSQAELNGCSLLEFFYKSIVFQLEQHCHILQQKTVRNKIIAFLRYQSECQKSKTVRVEIPYSDLSDFLKTDRSSLTKELAKMNEQKQILRNGRNITLLI